MISTKLVNVQYNMQNLVKIKVKGKNKGKGKSLKIEVWSTKKTEQLCRKLQINSRLS